MRRSIESLLYPDLTRIAPQHRGHALRSAREEPLDLFESVGIVGVILFVTVLTRYSLPQASASSAALAAIVNFIAAVPMIALLTAPFHIRRVRRGLLLQIGPRK